MRLRPTLLTLAVAIAAAGTSAAAQTAAPAAPTTRPATATQPAVRTPAAAAKSAVATPAASKPAAAPAAKAEPIDINTATSADLKTIPGIGDAYATKIINGRPYHSKDELARKKILPAGVYTKVKDRIVAHQH